MSVDSPYFRHVSIILLSSRNFAPCLSFQSWAGPPWRGCPTFAQTNNECFLDTPYHPKDWESFPQEALSNNSVSQEIFLEEADIKAPMAFQPWAILSGMSPLSF